MSENGGGKKDGASVSSKRQWNTAPDQKARGWQKEHRETYVSPLSSEQLDSIHTDFGDSPIPSITHDASAGQDYSMSAIDDGESRLWGRILDSILPNRIRLNQRFRRSIRLLSNELGNLLNLFLVSAETHLPPERAAAKIVFIYTLLKEKVGVDAASYSKIVRARLVIHLSNISKSNQVIDWYVSLTKSLEPKKVALLISCLPIEDRHKEHIIQRFARDLIACVLSVIAQLVIEKLSQFSDDELRSLVRIPKFLCAEMELYEGKREKVFVLDELLNEIHGRLDVSGWKAMVLNQKKGVCEKIFTELMALSNASLKDQAQIVKTYQRLVRLFEAIETELSYPMLGPLKVLIIRLNQELLEVAVKRFSDDQILSILKASPSPVLFWLKDKSGEDSRLYSLIDRLPSSPFP